MCPKCGTENKDDANLCSQCGATLGKQESLVPKKSSRGKSWKLYAIGIAIVVAILILISVCVFLVKIPPGVETEDAAWITANSAVLNGTLTRLGDATSVDISFQWGTSSKSYPNETEAKAAVRTGTFEFALTGLTSNTTYYYRVKAVGNSTTYGTEKSFTTP